MPFSYLEERQQDMEQIIILHEKKIPDQNRDRACGDTEVSYILYEIQPIQRKNGRQQITLYVIWLK